MVHEAPEETFVFPAARFDSQVKQCQSGEVATSIEALSAFVTVVSDKLITQPSKSIKLHELNIRKFLDMEMSIQTKTGVPVVTIIDLSLLSRKNVEVTLPILEDTHVQSLKEGLPSFLKYFSIIGRNFTACPFDLFAVERAAQNDSFQCEAVVRRFRADRGLDTEGTQLVQTISDIFPISDEGKKLSPFWVNSMEFMPRGEHATFGLSHIVAPKILMLKTVVYLAYL